MDEANLIEFSSDEEDCDSPLGRISANPMKRMAIVDTCNVLWQCAGMAWNCRETNNEQRTKKEGKADAIGVMLLVQQLLAEDFDIRLFVLESYMNEAKVSNLFILKMLQQLGLLIVIDRGSLDDRVMLEMAKHVAGFVISNDQYRDHLESVGPLFDTIRQRTCQIEFDSVPLNERTYIWLKNNVFRYRSAGIQLRLRPRADETLYAKPDDPTYGIVYQNRLIMDRGLRERAIEEMGICADYVQRIMCLYNSVKPPELGYISSNSEVSDFSIFREMYFISKYNSGKRQYSVLHQNH